MYSKRTTIGVLFIIFSLSLGCSHEEMIKREDLHSKLISAISLATESQFFLRYVREQRATRPYATGHIEYLEDELSRAELEVRKSNPEPGTETAFHEYEANLDALRRELANINAVIDNPGTDPDLNSRIANIRNALDATNSLP